MNMHEGFSGAPKKTREQEVSELSIGSSVIRNGETRIIKTMLRNATGFAVTFDDGNFVQFDKDEKLEVPST